MLRRISVREIQKKKNIYLRFIDYAKAFGNVRHKELSEQLGTLELFGKYIA